MQYLAGEQGVFTIAFEIVAVILLTLVLKNHPGKNPGSRMSL